MTLNWGLETRSVHWGEKGHSGISKIRKYLYSRTGMYLSMKLQVFAEGWLTQNLKQIRKLPDRNVKAKENVWKINKFQPLVGEIWIWSWVLYGRKTKEINVKLKWWEGKPLSWSIRWRTVLIKSNDLNLIPIAHIWKKKNSQEQSFNLHVCSMAHLCLHTRINT